MHIRSTITGVVVLTLILSGSGCSKRKASGSWLVLDTGFGNAFYEINFVDESTGWVNGQSDRSFEPPEAGEKKNKAQSLKQTKTDTKDQLKANQGFEVLRTTDAGQSWNQIPNQFKYKIRSVWFVSPARGWALTIDRDILVTSDGGMNWKLQRKAGVVKLKLPGNRLNPELDQPEQIEHLFFLDEAHGWAWGGGTHSDYAEQPGVLLVTLNGGDNWDSVPFPFGQSVYSIFFLNQNSAWASTEGDGFYRTTDGGLTWDKLEGKLPETVLRSIFFVDSNNGWAVGKSGRLARSGDGGKTWQRMYKIKPEFQMRDVFFTSRDSGWAVGENGAILHTQDGGENWVSLETGTSSVLLDVLFVGNQSGWAAGLEGTMMKFSNEQ